jgi:hypothetical protein
MDFLKISLKIMRKIVDILRTEVFKTKVDGTKKFFLQKMTNKQTTIQLEQKLSKQKMF